MDRVLTDELVELVFMVEDELAIAKRVQTGIQDNNFIQIIDGLEDGNEVITDPYTAISRRLEPYSPVEIVDRDELFKDN